MQTPAPFGYERATSVSHAVTLLEQLGPEAMRELERGREILPGEYPTTAAELIAQTQVSSHSSEPVGPPTGLYDFRVGLDIAVLIGCGLGGTSLINANVALEADPRVLQSDGWPKALSDGPPGAAAANARACSIADRRTDSAIVVRATSSPWLSLKVS